MATAPGRAVRLRAVDGLEGQSNDLVYCPPATPGQPHDVVVLFPGDIQNFPEDMQQSEHLKYNLEAVAGDLSRKLPDKHVLVVRPVRTEKGCFNFYDNFVTTGKFGGPDHTGGRRALPHLRRLVTNGLRGGLRAHGGALGVPPQQAPLLNSVAVVGFSKGCVVLNQMLTEMYLLADLEETERQACLAFLSKVTEMAWLDGGHQGREGTWVTNPNLVSKMFATIPSLSVTIHVTPYQMMDSSRPWIGKECARFAELCRVRSPRVRYAMHGDQHTQRSLETHFRALDAYGAPFLG